MRSLSSRQAASIVALLAAVGVPSVARPAEAGRPASSPIALTAPKSFDEAVRAVEDATGAKGTKLHELPLSEARAFSVEPAVAERLLEGSHAPYRSAGIFLFRHERSFGVAGDKDLLALMKTGDWRAVVRRIGTAGPRSQPSSEAITGWLDALAKEEPFDLREVGTDYLAGRFDRPPKDPSAVARRCAEFAPELVAGRASTLDLLAKEIETRATLYLIW
jgi:hypothetical protein